MKTRRVSPLAVAGLGFLVAGIAIRQASFASPSHFLGGFFLGLSIVLLVAGLIKTRAGKAS